MIANKRSVLLLGLLAVMLSGGAGYWWAWMNEPAIAQVDTFIKPGANKPIVSTAIAPSNEHTKPAEVEYMIARPAARVQQQVQLTQAAPSAKGVPSSPAASAAALKPQGAKPIPLGAGMPTRIVSAGGAQTGSALDLVWEANLRQAHQPSPTPASGPDWKIMGAVQRTDSTFLLIQFDGQTEPRMFKLGDKLPGGGVVAWVRPNTLGVAQPEGSLNVPILDGQNEELLMRQKKLLTKP